MSAPELAVQVLAVVPTGALATVDGVLVHIDARQAGLPLWLCNAHPSDGRTSCPHIAALAATPLPAPGTLPEAPQHNTTKEKS